jgi:hypothetical protein
MRIYKDLCEGRRVYADLYGFMRRTTDLCGSIWIYAKDHGFMRIYKDLCEGRRIYTDLYGIMRRTTDLCRFIMF